MSAGASSRPLEGNRRLALALLFLAPSLFASNMLIARATADLVPPVALAFWRWAVTLAIVLPMTAVPLWRSRRALAREWLQFLVLGALGMGVCGAFVYIGADTASATNIGLIYASSPIMIIVLASLFGHERLNARQGLGIFFSLIGVLTVISRGDLDALLALRFTEGDLWIITSAFAWAVYSLLLRYWRSSLPPMARFAATVACGVFVLAPAALWEGLNVGWPVLNKETVGAVLFLAVFASFAAYQVYAMIQRSLGAGLASLMLYLSPIYLAILAFLLLGETLKPYHYVGAALVLPGIYLATRRPKPQTTRDL